MVRRCAALFEYLNAASGFLGNSAEHLQEVLAQDGTMVYVTGSSAGGTGNTEYLVWVERDGTFAQVDPAWPHMNLSPPTLSPDGSKVALAIEAGNLLDVWTKELPDGPLTRLTHGGGTRASFEPVWTPDGRSVVFTSAAQDSAREVRRVRADGSTSDVEVLLHTENGVRSPRMTPDGAGFLFRTSSETSDVGYHDIEADSTVMLLTQQFDEEAPTVSPDGRWLAYVSDVTGQREVFVRPFPAVGQSRTQVSNGGGREPLWAHNGREIFYRSGGGGTGSLMSATYSADSVFTVESRQTLFEMGRDYINRPFSLSYDVDATDQRFLMVRNAEAVGPGDTESASMILVQNWFVELAERLGEGN